MRFKRCLGVIWYTRDWDLLVRTRMSAPGISPMRGATFLKLGGKLRQHARHRGGDTNRRENHPPQKTSSHNQATLRATAGGSPIAATDRPSSRSTVIGSTRAARLAATQAASMPTSVVKTQATPSATGSSADTLNERLFKTRVSAREVIRMHEPSCRVAAVCVKFTIRWLRMYDKRGT